MPRNVKEFLKHEVFTVEEGLLVGRAQDVLIDPDVHEVAVVVLAMRGSEQVATVVPGKQVRSYSEDTIPVASLSAIRLAYQAPEVLELLLKGLHFRGRDVFTSEGHNAGRIVDVHFDDNGKVLEYRVSKGWWRRLLRLSSPLLPSQLQTAGEHVAVRDVPPSQDI